LESKTPSKDGNRSREAVSQQTSGYSSGSGIAKRRHQTGWAPAQSGAAPRASAPKVLGGRRRPEGFQNAGEGRAS